MDTCQEKYELQNISLLFIIQVQIKIRCYAYHSGLVMNQGFHFLLSSTLSTYPVSTKLTLRVPIAKNLNIDLFLLKVT